MTIVFFGDSLFDTFNLTSLLKPFEPFEPFPAGPIYGGGGKASNDLVGSEAIAKALGIEPDSLVARYTSLTDSPNLFKENVVYAIAGAIVGNFDLQDETIGTIQDLEFQVATFLSDCDKSNKNEVDAMFSIGSNDAFRALNDPNFLKIIFTPNKSDDLRLINDVATRIFDNINKAIDAVDDYTDDIVIIGLVPLGDTPGAIKVDRFIDSLLPGIQENNTRDLLTGIAGVVNNKLINKYDFTGPHDVEDVLVIDGFKFLRSVNPNNPSGLDIWKDQVEMMGMTPYTEISYSDYLTFGNLTGLPPGLKIAQFAFIDDVHSNSSLNKIVAKNIIAPAILEEFSSFGT
jgi:hypothetical protein